MRSTQTKTGDQSPDEADNEPEGLVTGNEVDPSLIMVAMNATYGRAGLSGRMAGPICAPEPVERTFSPPRTWELSRVGL